MKDIDKAIDYYQKGLKMTQKDSSNLMIGVFHQNLGLIFYENNRLDSAKQYISIALDIFRSLNDESQTTFALNNLGLTEHKLGNIAAARQNLTEALSIATRRGFKESIIDATYNLAEIDYLEGNQLVALEEFIALEQLAKEQGNIYRQREIAAKVERIYAERNQFTQAYQYSKKVQVLSDSIFNAETYSKIYDIETKYDVEKKNYEIALLSKNNELSEIQLKRTKTNLAYTISLAFVLFVLALTSNVAFNNKKRLNRQLVQQKTEIEKQKTEIEKQKEFIAIQHDKIEAELKNTLLKAEVSKR